MARPKPGDTFTFRGFPAVATVTDPETGEQSEQTVYGPHGSDQFAMRPGVQVEVRELVSADTPGAHNGEDDAVVVEWDQPTLEMVDGEPRVGAARRATSFSEAEFDSMFEGA